MKDKKTSPANKCRQPSAQSSSARSLAAAIAAALFKSSDGKRADRLVFRLQSGEDWGGWSEPAATDWIAKIIEAHQDKVR